MEKLEKVLELMRQLAEDTTIPKNIRAAVKQAIDSIEQKKESDLAVGLSEAIYALEEVSGDINLPMHARTQIWQILSALEEIKESLR